MRYANGSKAGPLTKRPCSFTENRIMSYSYHMFETQSLSIKHSFAASLNTTCFLFTRPRLHDGLFTLSSTWPGVMGGYYMNDISQIRQMSSTPELVFKRHLTGISDDEESVWFIVNGLRERSVR